MDDKFATQFLEAIPAAPDQVASPPDIPRYLILLQGGTPGAMVPLKRGGLSIGRSDENGLVLPEPSVSRCHADIRLDDSGVAWITDRASTNGTFQNGVQVPPHTPSRLVDGDRLRLGMRVVLKYMCLSPEEEAFQKSMFERTVRDPLTGLYNRAYFLDQLGWLAAQSAGRGQGLAIVMLDIDRFKSVNDNYGHQGGDVILQQVAALIRLATRSEDLVARFGGEEFAIALPIGSEEDALDRAERIRTALASRRIAFGAKRIRVTASLGVAYTSRSARISVDGMIAAADRALYRAKEAGRNRVARSREPQMDTPLTFAAGD